MCSQDSSIMIFKIVTTASVMLCYGVSFVLPKMLSWSILMKGRKVDVKVLSVGSLNISTDAIVL